jgi:hypothetical protein
MSRRKKYGYCAYCGDYDILTRDHVIPQCLFVGGTPGDVPRVYACSTCNGDEKSSNDTYLRDLLVMDMDSSEHPVVKQLFDKFVRAIKRNQSKAARDAMQSTRPIPLMTPSGLYAGWAWAFESEDKRNEAIMSMIVRGLYIAYIGGKLPANSTFDIFRQRDMSKLDAALQSLLRQGAQHVRIGNSEVFECIYAHVPEQPEVSIWFLCFYEKVIFTVATNLYLTDVQNAS